MLINPSIKHYVGAELEPYTPPRHTLTSNLRLLPGDDADGEVSVVRGTIEQGGSALPHRHLESTQFLHILSGRCSVDLDSQTLELGGGDSVLIPTDVVHHVEVLSLEPLELINVYYPALAPDDTIE